MRLLLIEDDDTIGAELHEGLALAGFDVTLRTDGRSGLMEACDQNYDAIILDLLLPELNGYRVLSELRSNRVDAAVLVLTAKSGEYDLAEVFESGADDFMSKPFSFVELVARLQNLIRRRNRTTPRTFTCGDLVLDPIKRVAKRGEALIGLTPTEFRVLERLLANAPDIVTRQELLDEIWDLNNPPHPNIVQIYVGYLRRKIDGPFGAETIITHRGIGYQVKEPVL